MIDRTSAEAFPPGEFLREELEARGWTQADLAAILGRPEVLVNEVINAKRAITPETARGLGEAFGTSAELWLSLQNAWQLTQTPSQSPVVSRRAKLYSKTPVKEIIRRGWIEQSDHIDVLEKQIVDFLEIDSIDDHPVSRQRR